MVVTSPDTVAVGVGVVVTVGVSVGVDVCSGVIV